ncbi:hypothetical protein ACLOJK_037069 [Asimina triloba]
MLARCFGGWLVGSWRDGAWASGIAGRRIWNGLRDGCLARGRADGDGGRGGWRCWLVRACCRSYDLVREVFDFAWSRWDVDGSGLLPALEELLAQGAVDEGGGRRLDRAARGRTAMEMGHDLTIFGVVTLLPTFWTAPIS